MFVHPDRYGVVKTVPNLWAILHTSEGGESTGSAEALCDFMRSPGDRIKRDANGNITQQYGSSYHVVFDTDRVIPAVPYNTVSYSAGGGNAHGIHGCFPGKAAQTRAQWLDENSRAMIRQAAAWLVDIADQFAIPIDRKMPAYEMLAGDKGLGDHYTVTVAFAKSDHTDVGSGFPWDVLFADIAALTTPTEPIEENADMFRIRYRDESYAPNAYTGLICNGPQLGWIGDGNADIALGKGGARIVDNLTPAELDALIKTLQTTSQCPPEWVNTARGAAWNARRG